MGKPRDSKAVAKEWFNRKVSRRKVLAFKLKRTDTTLDLSLEAKRAKEQMKRARETRLIYLVELAIAAGETPAVAESTWNGV
jgi:hypothetical protein